MKFHSRVLCCVIFISISIWYYIKYRTYHVKPQLKLPPTLKSLYKTEFVYKDSDCTLSYKLKNHKEETFQRVDLENPLSHGYVYSAYYDDRNTKKVVIVSLFDRQFPDLHCIMWFSNRSVKVKAVVYSIPENADRKYSASLINCHLPTKHSSKESPKFVSVIVSKCEKIVNILSVQRILKMDLPRQFSICVTPFNLNYNNVDQLLEMLSINELMGANHVFFYNYSTGKDVERVLSRFIDRGFVTILPWHLPMKVHVWPIPDGYVEEVKYFGQMAMLNDCLYRNMGLYKYVVFSDLDEYLIPRAHRNWHDLFQRLINRKYKNANGFFFRNVFFKTEWPSDPDMEKNQTIVELKAMSLLKVRREPTIYMPFQRSKMILDPLMINVVGVHNVWNQEPGAVLVVLDPEEGLCHHYRFWDGLGEKEFVEDRNIFRLRDDIVDILIRNRKLLL